MEIAETPLPDVKIVRPVKYPDHRGVFFETFSKRLFTEAGIAVEFVQDNHVASPRKGTLRGLHFQTPPCAQAKLVRVVRGAVWDVAVDLRHGSPTYGHHVGIELTAESGDGLYLPVGFAHGYCTLEPDTELIYKVSAPYAPEHDGGVIWNDADLNIPWPVSPEKVILAERDRGLPALRNLPEIFWYR